jgi:dTDP-4-amino-4,6-dideoxygalactose transaminase
MTPSLDRPIRFAPPAIGRPEIDAAIAALESGWLSTGPQVKAFEQAFADYVGARHAVALSSGTAAIHLALLASGVGPGDEVVTTPLTFCSTAHAVVHTGAAPVFADIDPVTWNLSPDSAVRAMTPRTRAVIPVHYAGRPVDVAGFRELARRHGVAIIEDAAHAVEAVSGGQKIGAAADFTCFSFYATKNLTTGEGGMLTTASDDGAAFARVAALHGMTRDAWARYAPGGSPHYDVVMPGYKYNMMDLQAAIGLQQLRGIDARLAHRDRLWQLYDEGLADLPLVRPAPIASGDRHARHLYTVLVEEASGWSRDALARSLTEDGITTSVHFRALHLQPYYAERFGLSRGMFPCAERVSDTILSLPFSAVLREDEVHRVVDALRVRLLHKRGLR